MENYDALIIESFIGSTPKERYEDFKKMELRANKNAAKIDNLKTFFESIKETSDNATLGNIRSFIDAYQTTLNND